MKKEQKIFLSCDWGTSRFRLRLIDAEEEHILAEVRSDEGIAATYQAWKEAKRDEKDRLLFYCSVIQKHMVLLEQKHVLQRSMMIIVSGMASSALGMKELPYKEVPFLTSGDDLPIYHIESIEGFCYNLYLIPGLKTEYDVMRGEETQIVGCASQTNDSEQIIILPGTHSKHAFLSNGKIVSFTTSMTGDFFRMLLQNTILSQNIEEGAWHSISHQEAFSKAVLDSQEMNLLQSSFRVRTNGLLQRMTKQENYFYLSGLLIGCELQSLARNTKLTLVADQALCSLYEKALEVLNFYHWAQFDADVCLLKGQVKFYRRLVTSINT